MSNEFKTNYITYDMAVEIALKHINETAKIEPFEFNNLPDNMYNKEQFRNCYIFIVSFPRFTLLLDGEAYYIGVDKVTGKCSMISVPSGG